MVIDEHRHIGHCHSNGWVGANDIIGEMDRLGIDRAVIVPSGLAGGLRMSPEEDEARQQRRMKAVQACLDGGEVSEEAAEMRRDDVDHSEVLKAVREHGDRFVGCWFVNPWSGERSLGEARRAIRELGFGYMKAHPMAHAFAADGEIIYPVMEEAAALDVPVWFHTSYGPGTEIRRVVALARRFPDTKIILGHAAVGDLEGNKHSVEAAEAARKLSNVWIDLSDCRLPAMRQMIENAPQDRLLYASDAPYGPADRQIRQVQEITGGNRPLYRRIMGENAAELLKM